MFQNDVIGINIKSMNAGSLIFYSLSVISAILYFLFISLKKESVSKIIMPFCILFLAIGTTFLLPNKPLVFMALYLACIGDFLLLKNKNKIFSLFGTTSYLLCHIAFFVAICTLISDSGINIPFWIYIVIVCSIVVISLIIYPFGIHIIGKQSVPFTMYIVFILLIILTSIQLIVIYPNRWIGICITIGYISFIISDIFLGYSLFHKELSFKNYVVVGTYLGAVYLITLGFSLAFI